MTNATYESILAIQLKKALHMNIIKGILATGNEPTIVEKWRSRATAIDNALRASNSYSRPTPTPFKLTPRPNPPPFRPNSSTPALPAGEPMDVDRMRKEGHCFKCQQKRHLSRDCPTRRTVRQMLQEMTGEENKELANAVAEMKELDFA